MGIRYENLDSETRKYMVEESKIGGHYVSPRLTSEGQHGWPRLLEDAIANYDDNWLAAEIIKRGYLNRSELYVRNGKQCLRTINQQQASQQLAEGEFNRYYIRGLCIRAKSSGATGLIVYRGKAVTNPRPESEAKIGSTVQIDLALSELRKNDFISIGDALGVPGGPNSGITCKLP